MPDNDREFSYRAEDSGRFQLKDGKKRLAAIGVFLLLIILEACFSKTDLITPFSRLGGVLRLGIAAFGFGVGLWIGMRLNANFPGHRGRVRSIVFVIGLAILGAGLFAHIASRISNHWEFIMSDAPYESVSYPIVGVDDGQGPRSEFQTASVAIAPYTRSETNIPIPNKQYDEIADKYHGLCVTVEQRQSASGAIQVADTGDYRLSVPLRKNIEPCDVIEARLRR